MNAPIVPSVRKPLPKRRLWKRALGWSLVGVALVLFAMLLAALWRIRQIAKATSRASATISADEIAAEDARLERLGLRVPNAHFLKPRPFDPPWTSQSLLLPSNLPPEPAVKSWFGVRADLLLADLDVLQPVMERAYGGWDTAAARGWNWNQWFADWRKQLAARGSAWLSYDEAFAPLDTLLAFQRDNHTQIPLARAATRYGDGSQTAVLDGMPGGPCQTIRAGGGLFPIAANDAAQHVRSAKMWITGAINLRDTAYISMPHSYGKPQAVECGGRWISLQPVGARPRHGWLSRLGTLMWSHKQDAPRIERIALGIVYARLPQFSGDYYEGVSDAGWAQRQIGDLC